MTGVEYLAIIERLGISGPAAAKLFGYGRQIHYSTWKKIGPPLSVAMCLRIMEKHGHTPEQFKAFAS